MIMPNLVELKNISLIIKNISIINNVSLSLGNKGITLITGQMEQARVLFTSIPIRFPTSNYT